MLPQFLSHERQCIRKSWQGLAIPGILPDRDLAFLGMRIGQQSHQREQAQQGRCGASDGPIRPLALGLHAEMVSDFMKSDFQLPAHHEPFQDLFRFFVQVRAQQGLRFELALSGHGSRPSGLAKAACHCDTKLRWQKQFQLLVFLRHTSLE